MILEGMNLQDGGGEEEEICSPPRKKRAQKTPPPRMSYSQVTTPKRNKEEPQRQYTSKSTEPRHRSPAGSLDEDASTVVEGIKESKAISSLKDKLNKMQEQFEACFGRVDGTDMETTKRLIEENKKKMQKLSEEYFDKKFQETSDLILNKFTEITSQQNTTILALQSYVTQEIQKLYDNRALLPMGTSLAIPPLPLQGAVASPSRAPQASDGEP